MRMGLASSLCLSFVVSDCCFVRISPMMTDPYKRGNIEVLEQAFHWIFTFVDSRLSMCPGSCFLLLRNFILRCSVQQPRTPLLQRERNCTAEREAPGNGAPDGTAVQRRPDFKQRRRELAGDELQVPQLRSGGQLNPTPRHATPLIHAEAGSAAAVLYVHLYCVKDSDE